MLMYYLKFMESLSGLIVHDWGGERPQVAEQMWPMRQLDLVNEANLKNKEATPVTPVLCFWCFFSAVRVCVIKWECVAGGAAVGAVSSLAPT